MSTQIEYQLRVRNGDDSDDLFVVSSVRDGENPFIEGPPEGDGESVDPLTGKVEVGSYTIRVIDAVGTVHFGGVLASDGFEYDDLTAVESAWPETDTMGSVSTWSLSTSVFDSGTKSLQLHVLGNPGGGTNAYRTRTFTGLPANQACTVTVRCWLNKEALGSQGIAFGVEVDGGAADYVGGHGAIFTWQTLTVPATTNGSGELTLRLGAFGAISSNYDRLARFDTLNITAPTQTAVNRLITGYLADATGRQQLLSKRAYIEERQDGGAWSPVACGYSSGLAGGA